ncbi:hypothetical protein COLO4_28138 [Corchorus olitorius]|uniref:J domain-containing protein n=1 Tax=Corchorus olitorius TaxID=93759 RepID=A0A1R3HMQ9_9ROSI|nr:hypothetical protein COLO4_28138 [Corchorus olitorius]
MDCNRDEAIRVKELAEKKLEEKDAAGAKKFALKAQNLYPELDGLRQLLAILDVYIYADKKINGEADWYSVLGVQPSADEDTIRKHYRKLALILHPDKNKSVGADGAFKLLSEAWNMLSDKEKRIAYDRKRNSRGSHTNVLNGSSCMMHFEYERKYVNFNLTCKNCHKRFLAVETPAPVINNSRMYTPVFPQFHNTGPGRFSGLHSSTKLSQKDATRTSGSNINMAPAASLTAQAAGLTHLARETLHKESQAGSMREESISMKFHPSQKTYAGLSTGTSSSASTFPTKMHRPKKKRSRDEREMGNHMAMGNEGVYHSSFDKSGCETGGTNIAGISRTNGIKEPPQLGGRNILMDMAKKEICKKLNLQSTASLSKASNKQKAFNKGMDEKDVGSGKDAQSMKPAADKSMEFVDTKSSIQPKKSYTVDAEVDLTTEEPDPMSMNVPDADFHDFDNDRTEKSFGENQVWAAYDDDDGMPRFYAMIHSVVSRKPFKMRMSWLNSKSNMELGSLNWIGSGFRKTSGEFWIGKYEAYKTLNSFSHRVKWSKGRKGAIQIYPRMGDVWALYKNWSSDWNAHTPDEVIHKYVMVEVLEDYNEQRGVAVAPLVKVPGFKTVFQKHSEASRPWMIPREELFRFSHQVPSYVLTGQEGQNAPQGCMELDPAAAPLELLQVLTEAQIKEMEVISGRAQEETVLGDLKVSKEKDLLENDQKVKPNVSKGGVAEAVMEEEIKEEKENKKPVKLVYKRCRRRKQEC